MTGLLDLGLSNYIDLMVYKLLTLQRTFNQHLTIDTIALQKRINKLCKKYSLCARTSRRTIDRLAQVGLIKIVYNIGFGKFVIEVRSFDDLFGQDSDSETDVLNVVVAEKSPNSDTKGDSENKSQKTAIDQQQLIFTDQITKSVGIVFQKRDIWKIAQYPKDEISRAIDYFKFSREKNDIPSPTGWLIRCLQHKWYLSFKKN